jgi:hypothetical protein
MATLYEIYKTSKISQSQLCNEFSFISLNNLKFVAHKIKFFSLKILTLPSLGLCCLKQQHSTPPPTNPPSAKATPSSIF